MSTTRTTTRTTTTTTTTTTAPEAAAGEEGAADGAAAPYDLTDGPLRCEDVWPLLRRKDKGLCRYQWHGADKPPAVLCELIGGYKPIAGSYTTLIHNAATYQVLDTVVGNATGNGGDGAGAAAGTTAEAATGRRSGLCAYQSVFEMRKVDTLAEVTGVPISEDETLIQIAMSERGPNGEEGETLLALVSQGFKSIRLELRPDAIGAKGALLSDYKCTECPPEVWVISYAKRLDVVQLYMNRAWRIYMEFNPAYMKLATFLLRYLEEGAYVEEVEIHGGERWSDTVVIPTPVLRLRSLDFAGNGLSALDDVNFHRTPNLLHLNLSNNKFLTIPAGIQLLSRLKTLDLSQNPIVATQFAPVLRPLIQLEELNLSDVPLGSLDPLAPSDLQNDTDEGTNGNATVDRQLFAQLKVLDVGGCNVSDLSGPGARAVLRQLRALRELRLSYNTLGALPPDLVEQLPALQTLRAARCALSDAPALRLAPSQRLRLLDLSYNALHAPGGALALHNAGAGADLLDLSGNPLRAQWSAYTFKSLGAGATVNLSRTDLATFTRSMLRSLDGLRAVDLGDNPIDCSNCSTPDLQQWLANATRRGPTVLSLGTAQPLRCLHPPAARGRAVRAAAAPPAEQCATAGAGGGWSGVAVAGAVAAGALLAAGMLALLAFRFRLELTYVLHVLRANRAVKGGGAVRDGSPLDAECDFDAFVCYSKYDRAWVLGELLPRLEGGHPRYRLCLHERDFPLGSLIVQNIVECMARSRRTLIVLTRAFVDSQWCQWELEMATHRLLEGARDFLVLVELERMDARALPRLLRLLVETRTFLEWPTGCGPGGCCGGGALSAEETAWKRLRAALGPPLRRVSARRASARRAGPAPAPADAAPAPAAADAATKGDAALHV